MWYLFAGFNVETVEYKNISFTVWDVGGQDKVRRGGRWRWSCSAVQPLEQHPVCGGQWLTTRVPAAP